MDLPNLFLPYISKGCQLYYLLASSKGYGFRLWCPFLEREIYIKKEICYLSTYRKLTIIRLSVCCGTRLTDWQTLSCLLRSLICLRSGITSWVYVQILSMPQRRLFFPHLKAPRKHAPSFTRTMPAKAQGAPHNWGSEFTSSQRVSLHKQIPSLQAGELKKQMVLSSSLLFLEGRFPRLPGQQRYQTCCSADLGLCLTCTERRTPQSGSNLNSSSTAGLLPKPRAQAQA